MNTRKKKKSKIKKISIIKNIEEKLSEEEEEEKLIIDLLKQSKAATTNSMSSGAGSGKRAVADTSIDSSLDFEDDNSIKKTKMEKDSSIMILDVGGRYVNAPNQLKVDLDSICITNSIKE